MSRSEFIHRANYGPLVRDGVTFNASKSDDVHARSGRMTGFWHYCAPVGARCAFPTGLPSHGPAICGAGEYAHGSS